MTEEKTLMARFLEPGRRTRRAGFILCLGGCLAAAVLLVPVSAPPADPTDEPPPAPSEGHDSGAQGLFRTCDLESSCDKCSEEP